MGLKALSLLHSFPGLPKRVYFFLSPPPKKNPHFLLPVALLNLFFKIFLFGPKLYAPDYTCKQKFFKSMAYLGLKLGLKFKKLGSFLSFSLHFRSWPAHLADFLQFDYSSLAGWSSANFESKCFYVHGLIRPIMGLNSGAILVIFITFSFIANLGDLLSSLSLCMPTDRV